MRKSSTLIIPATIIVRTDGPAGEHCRPAGSPPGHGPMSRAIWNGANPAFTPSRAHKNVTHALTCGWAPAREAALGEIWPRVPAPNRPAGTGRSLYLGGGR